METEKPKATAEKKVEEILGGILLITTLGFLLYMGFQFGVWLKG